MDFDSNEDWLEDPKTQIGSTDKDAAMNGQDPQITEAELCETYGYELAMSPARTVVPEDDDVSWLSDEPVGVPKEDDGFDLLEPFLVDSSRKLRRPSELTWYSDDSNDSHTSGLNTCTVEFNDLELDLFISEDPLELVKLLSDDEDNPTPHNNEQLSSSTQRLSNGEDVDRNLYPVSNNQQASEILSENSKEEPARSVELSEAAQREKYISETTEIVRSLVRQMTLGQKTRFYAWFNSGLSIEEAAVKSKIPDLIPPPVRHPNCKLSKKRLRRLSMILPTVYLQRQFIYETYFAGAEPKQVMRYLLMDLDLEYFMDEFERRLELEELDTKEKRMRRSAPLVTHPPSSNSEDFDAPDGPPESSVSTAEPRSESDPNTGVLTLKGDELKAYYFWRKNGLPVNIAVSKAALHQPNLEILPHPDCQHSWEKLLQLAKALPCPKSREKLLVEVYFDGKDPGEVLKTVLSGSTDYHFPERDDFPGGVSALSENVENVEPPSCLSDEKDAEVDRGGKCLQSEEERVQEASIPAGASSGKRSKLSRLSLDEFKKYYGWRNQDFSHDQAYSRARIPELIPESVPHPSCKYSWWEIKAMSKHIRYKQSRLRFEVEVFYGGKNPKRLLERIFRKGTIPDSCLSLLKHEKVPGSWPSLLKHKKVPDSCPSLLKHENVPDSCPSLLKPVNEDSKASECDKGVESNRTQPLNDCSRAEEPLQEELDELRQLSTFKKKLYYKWRIKGFTRAEALEKAKTPGLFPGTVGCHPPASSSLKKATRPRFAIETFFGGQNRHGLLQQQPISQTQRSDADTSKNHERELPKSNEVDRSKESHQSESVEMHENLKTPSDEILNLSANALRRYYSWRNKGLTHVEAYSRVRNKKTPCCTNREYQQFYAMHPNCKHSRAVLKQMSKFLPDKLNQDRFVAHTYYGGMDPEDARRLLEPRALELNLSLPPELFKGVKDRDRVLWNMFTNFLKEKKLTPVRMQEVLSGRPRKLVKELEDVILVNCGRKPLPDGVSKELGSPYHPSHLLDARQMRYYDSYVTEGFSREEAFFKVIARVEATSMAALDGACPSSGPSAAARGKSSAAVAPDMVLIDLTHDDVPPAASRVNSTPANWPAAAAGLYPTHPADAPVVAHSVPSYPAEASHASSATVPEFSAPLLQYQPNPEQFLHYGFDPVPNPNTLYVYPLLQNQAVPVAAPTSVTYPPVEQHRLINTTDDPGLISSPVKPPERTKSHGELPNAGQSSPEDDTIRCFIVPATYPDEVFTEAQMDAIESSILEAILEMEDDDAKPSFKEAFRSDGRYGVLCNNEFSVVWLCKYLRLYQPWEGACLQLITNQRHRIEANAVLPLCKEDDKKILKFIEKQNVGLNVGKWLVVHRWDSSSGNTLMDLFIDEDSAKVLRSCSRISFKLGTAEIITAESNDCEPSSEQVAPPPPPPSPPPPTPPPPAPPPSPPVETARQSPTPVIDTSLGAMLKISASKSGKNGQTTKDSPEGTDNGLTSDWILEKRFSRKDVSKKRERSRSKSLEATSRRIRRKSSPGKVHRRRRSRKHRERSSSGSTSRGRAHRKKSKKHVRESRKRLKSPSMRSESRESLRKRSRPVSCSSGLEYPHRKLTIPNLSPPRPASVISLISSSEEMLDVETSIENMEYAEYLRQSPPPN